MLALRILLVVLNWRFGSLQNSRIGKKHTLVLRRVEATISEFAYKQLG